MKTNTKMYGQEYDPNVLKDIKTLNEKIDKAKDSEELFNLKLQRLYRGMEITSTPMTRNYRGYYPY
jgi:hypothetical protein